MKIMLIDDDPFVIALLRQQIATLKPGIPVEAFTEPRDALSYLVTGKDGVDLIICDLQMPGMDGIELVRALQRLRYRSNLVLLTGEDEAILRSAQKLATSYKLHVRGAFRKPITLQQLEQVIGIDAPAHTNEAKDNVKVYSVEELKTAIDNGALLNHYQPKVDLRTRQVIGVESLVRWNHPEDGMIFPDQFITLAENEGVIDELTWTVLENAIRDYREWLQEGFDIKVAVNVSMENLHRLDLPERVSGILDAAGIRPDRLIIEITESRLMKDPLPVLDILSRLRLKGISLSIDDFGTGNSSLVNLRDLPFSELKIDRGFVTGAHRDNSLQAIFEGSLNMARKLGIQCVAEGVEERDDWDFLVASGCDIAQGYFIAKPMPAANLKDFMLDWEVRSRSLAVMPS